MDVAKIAKLANLPVTLDQEKKLAAAFADTLKTVNVISKLDTSGISPTAQVDPELVNVTRKDFIDATRIIKIDDYFKVKAIFDRA